MGFWLDILTVGVEVGRVQHNHESPRLRVGLESRMLYGPQVVMASGVANQNAELMNKDQSLRVSNAQTTNLEYFLPRRACRLTVEVPYQ